MKRILPVRLIHLELTECADGCVLLKCSVLRVEEARRRKTKVIPAFADANLRVMERAVYQ